MWKKSHAYYNRFSNRKYYFSYFSSSPIQSHSQSYFPIRFPLRLEFHTSLSYIFVIKCGLYIPSFLIVRKTLVMVSVALCITFCCVMSSVRHTTIETPEQKMTIKPKLIGSHPLCFCQVFFSSFFFVGLCIM